MNIARKPFSEGLYAEIRLAIREARKAKGLSQAALGRQVGMVQRHISEIESGKTMPRLDTLLEILRTLNMDLVLVPKNLLPIVYGLLNSRGNPKETSLYAVDEDEEDDESDI